MGEKDPAEPQGGSPEPQGGTDDSSGGITKDSPILAKGDPPKDQGSEAAPKEQGSDAALKALEAKLEEALKDNAKYRRQAREREEQEQKENDAKLSEAERLTKELEAIKARAAEQEQALRTERLTTAAVAAAQAKGFHSPNAVMKRLSEFDSVEFSDDGKPDTDQIGKVIEQMVADEPYLIGTGGSAGVPDRSGKGNGESHQDKYQRIFMAGGGVPEDPSELPGGGVVVHTSSGGGRFSFGKDNSEG